MVPSAFNFLGRNLVSGGASGTGCFSAGDGMICNCEAGERGTMKQKLTLTPSYRKVTLRAPERGAIAVLKEGGECTILQVFDDELEIFVPAQVKEIFFGEEFSRFKMIFASFPLEIQDKFRYANEDTYDLRWYFTKEGILVPEHRKRIKAADCRRFYRIELTHAYLS